MLRAWRSVRPRYGWRGGAGGRSSFAAFRRCLAEIVPNHESGERVDTADKLDDAVAVIGRDRDKRDDDHSPAEQCEDEQRDQEALDVAVEPGHAAIRSTQPYIKVSF